MASARTAVAAPRRRSDPFGTAGRSEAVYETRSPAWCSAATARVGYQVGVLQNVARHAPGRHHRGAAGRHLRHLGRRHQCRGAGRIAPTSSTPPSKMLSGVWRDIAAAQVYPADSLGVIPAALATMLSIGWLLARWRKADENAVAAGQPPLAGTAGAHRAAAAPATHAVEAATMQALALSVSNYSASMHVTFIRGGRAGRAGVRAQRVAVPAELSVRTCWPRRRFLPVPGRRAGHRRRKWFGDGSMRCRPHCCRPPSPGCAAAAGDRRRARRRRAAAWTTPATQPGADRRACAVEHLPGRADRRRSACSASNCTLTLLSDDARWPRRCTPSTRWSSTPSQRLDEMAARRGRAAAHGARPAAPVGVSGSGPRLRRARAPGQRL